MEKDEAIELIDQLNEFIHELKLGIGAFILPPTGWGSSEEVGWNVLIDTSFIKEGTLQEIYDLIESKSLKWGYDTVSEKSVLRIYTPRKPNARAAVLLPVLLHRLLALQNHLLGQGISY